MAPWMEIRDDLSAGIVSRNFRRSRGYCANWDKFICIVGEVKFDGSEIFLLRVCLLCTYGCGRWDIGKCCLLLCGTR